jgi:hypothetical protein
LHEVAEEQHYVFGYVRNLCDLFLVGTPGVSENAARRSIREMVPSHFVATKFTLECRRGFALPGDDFPKPASRFSLCKSARISEACW